MLSEFELNNNAEATENICCAKGEGAVDRSSVTRSFKMFCLGCKNLDNQVRRVRSKTVDSEAVLPAIDSNSVSSTQRVSGKLGISQFSVVRHLHDLSKSIQRD